MTTTLRRAAFLLFLPLLLLAGLAVSTTTATKADAASSTTGDLTVCAYGVATRNVPIQLHLWSGSSWSVIRTGTTGTGCGTWRDVPANRWLAVTVKPTTYGSRDTCAYYPGSWYVLGGGTSSFYVSPWQSARVDLTVRKTYVYC
ncbi:MULTISPECIES: hypothetical protein [unclassified Nocardioides]|jgi:hypothetical protein|uniref:hypothetical protein n=1 Tax=unclassified Nocardioides TaxID=2615069 RepID=UPI0007028539|nr:MULTISPECIES: hypothetical protein [unclassified Nocardioides]KRC53526.1 hypothetical protein ASE19_14420 [Nocardioides sp. Root79]KRC67998.1 hypothetical protein ASE20_18335 [Nocardioides sp. Root240]